MTLRLMSVVGARPNFMKIAPFLRAVGRHPGALSSILVHTGQHYDAAMSDAFFRALQIPEPDVHLGIGSGSHAEQVGRTMIAFEKAVRELRPDWVVVVGDVNATCACAITARKEQVHLAHIEAGLRSFDMAMPEEINRLVTDRLSDLLFTTDEQADAHLRAEGVAESRIRRVGNIMIDALDQNRAYAAALSPAGVVAAQGLARTEPVPPLPDLGFAVLTLHRPSNVDDPAILKALATFFLEEVAADLPLVWPVHPRCAKQLQQVGLWERLTAARNIVMTQPVDYHAMLRLTMGARVLFTDSGGLQEESCVLGVPCLTLRWNTERPATLREHGGASVLVGNDVARIREEYRRARDLPHMPHRPPLWDGHAADRIVQAFLEQGGRAP